MSYYKEFLFWAALAVLLCLFIINYAPGFNEIMLRWFMARTVLLPRCWKKKRRKILIRLSSWADENYIRARRICLSFTSFFLGTAYGSIFSILIGIGYILVYLVRDFESTVRFIFTRYFISLPLSLGAYFVLTFLLFDIGIHGLRKLERSRSPHNIGMYLPYMSDYIRKKRRTFRRW